MHNNCGPRWRYYGNRNVKTFIKVVEMNNLLGQQRVSGTSQAAVIDKAARDELAYLTESARG